ncbi:MAG: hypothetical protein WB791_08845 [Waddliaceae bacterium]
MHALLLTSDIREPVSHILFTNRDTLNCPLIVLTLEDFLKQVEVFDEVINGVPKIEWTLPIYRITNSQDFFLINRVLSVPESLFGDFHPLDREYALAEFRAYLTFAIEAFPLALAKPGPGGLSGNRFSLPQQWGIVQKADIDISTPDYFLGNPKYSPLKETQLIVHSTPYNYYYWKPSVPSCKKREVNFCFSRPSGIPTICSILGEAVFVFPYFENALLDQSIDSQLIFIAKQLATTFEYSIAECLLFVDVDKITFGMISNIPYASRKKGFFTSALIQAFNTLIPTEACCEL